MVRLNFGLVSVCFLAVCIGSVLTEANVGLTDFPASSTKNESQRSTTTTGPSTTPESIDTICARLTNTSCSECVSNSKCFYCYKTEKCAHYPFNIHKFWIDGCGSMADMAWGTCWVNFQALIISMSVLAGVLLLSLTICCCCCCKKRKASLWARDQAKWERQREERKARSEERKKERQSKTDEIRRKYGLIKDDNPYQRFDA